MQLLRLHFRFSPNDPLEILCALFVCLVFGGQIGIQIREANVLCRLESNTILTRPRNDRFCFNCIVYNSAVHLFMYS